MRRMLAIVVAGAFLFAGWAPQPALANEKSEAKRQQKEPVQLDLFFPYEYGYDFKVIVTNKPLSMKQVIVYHDGRGSQEGVFAELKTHCAMGYVPVRSWLGNQAYLLAGLLAHNLIREFQMQTAPPCRKTTPKRAALWTFEYPRFRPGTVSVSFYACSTSKRAA